MDIVVLAGGLSTERDVSFKTGSMVAAALKENGHRVILLDVFMGYGEQEVDLNGTERMERMVRYRQHLTCLVSDIQEAII